MTLLKESRFPPILDFLLAEKNIFLIKLNEVFKIELKFIN